MSHRFEHPAGTSPRTAILLEGLRGGRRTTTLARGDHWLERLAEYRPECLAGTLPQLLYLATLAQTGAMVFSTVRHSLVVLQPVGDLWIEPWEREELWQAFQVPLYEVMLDPRGRTLAAECEVHDGLHMGEGQTWLTGPGARLWYALDRGIRLRPGDVRDTGLIGQLDVRPCACGSVMPRVHVLAAAPPPAAVQPWPLAEPAPGAWPPGEPVAV